MTDELREHFSEKDRAYRAWDGVCFVPDEAEVIRYAFEKAPQSFRAFVEDCDRARTTVHALLAEFGREEREYIEDYCGGCG